MSLDNIDLLISAHTHKPSLPPPIKRISFSGEDKITYRLVCTSYLNYGGYAIRGEYIPCPFVNQLVILKENIKKIKFEIE